MRITQIYRYFRQNGHRYLATLLAGALLIISTPAQAQSSSAVYEFPYDEGYGKPSVFKNIVAYPVNRVLDFIDIGSLNLGFGFGLHINVHLTRMLQLGFGGSTTSEVGLADGKREVGVFQEARAEFSLLFLSYESFSQYGSLGTVEDFDMSSSADRLYITKRDPLGVGFDLTALIVSVGGELRVVEIFDFLLGFAFVDFMGDDL